MLKWFVLMSRTKVRRDLTKVRSEKGPGLLIALHLCDEHKTSRVTHMEMEAGAFDEPREELPAALNAAMATNGERLMQQLMLLQQLPQVRLVPSSVFDRAKPPGSNPQLRGVSCKLRCCNKYIDQKCNALNGENACPTHVEAAEMLRTKVLEKHGSGECMAKAQATLAAEAEQAAGSSSSGAPVENAFAEMLGRQLAIQKAQRAVVLAETNALRLAEAERDASGLRAAADLAVEDVRLRRTAARPRTE